MEASKTSNKNYFQADILTWQLKKQTKVSLSASVSHDSGAETVFSHHCINYISVLYCDHDEDPCSYTDQSARLINSID